jgi:glucan 1,3-beta-glucosidase
MEFSRTAFGITIAGEWSVAINDCGLFVRGTTSTSPFAGCATLDDHSTWSEGTKAGFMRMAMASMDALRDWFFWTWKVNEAYDIIVRLKIDFINLVGRSLPAGSC